jgi:hypothetical protein
MWSKIVAMAASPPSIEEEVRFCQYKSQSSAYQYLEGGLYSVYQLTLGAWLPHEKRGKIYRMEQQSLLEQVAE